MVDADTLTYALKLTDVVRFRIGGAYYCAGNPPTVQETKEFMRMVFTTILNYNSREGESGKVEVCLTILDPAGWDSANEMNLLGQNIVTGLKIPGWSIEWNKRAG